MKWSSYRYLPLFVVRLVASGGESGAETSSQSAGVLKAGSERAKDTTELSAAPTQGAPRRHTRSGSNRPRRRLQAPHRVHLPAQVSASTHRI